MIRNRKRLWALLLSAALIVTQLPAVAMAENAAPEDKVNFTVGEREDALGYGSIASFEELPSGVANKTVDVGTGLSALNLPGAITASVYNVTEDMVIPDEDSTEESDDPTAATPSDADKSVSEGNAEDTSVKDSGKTVTTITTSKEHIPVTWDSEPAYDGDTEGSYVFTADVGGYVLSGSAKLPQITVTVAADTVEKPTGESLPCTQTEGCTLQSGHEGRCVTEQPRANDALVKNITGWKFVSTEYSDYIGNELAIPSVSMERQADLAMVVSMLPTQISAVIDGEEAPETLDITRWDCPEYVKTGEGSWPVSGEYTFTAALPPGYSCDPLPAIQVMIGGGDLLSGGASWNGQSSQKASDLGVSSGETITITGSNSNPNGAILKIDVDNITVTSNGSSVNGVSIQVDSSVASLTIKELDLTPRDGRGSFGIKFDSTSTLKAEGSCTIYGPFYDDAMQAVIRSIGGLKLKVADNAELKIIGDQKPTERGNQGIWTTGSLIVDVGSGGSLTVENTRGRQNNGSAIYSENSLNINNNGTVLATVIDQSGASSGAVYGINAMGNTILSGSGTTTARGKTGLSVKGDLTVDGHVLAEGTDVGVTLEKTSGQFCKLTGSGELTAEAIGNGKDWEDGCGIWVLYAGLDMAFEGKLTVHGGIGGIGCGIYVSGPVVIRKTPKELEVQKGTGPFAFGSDDGSLTNHTDMNILLNRDILIAWPDIVPPSVLVVDPDGTAGLNGRVGMIFSETIKDGPGTVTLTGGGDSITLTGGYWDVPYWEYSGKSWFIIDYAGLKNSTTYTVNISGFQDKAGNVMAADSSHTFTTVSGWTATATPVAAPAGGAYSTAQTVTLTCATGGATIVYTLDGSDPLTSGTWQIYSAPFTVPLGTTLKACAVAPGYGYSTVLTEIYTKKPSSGGSSGGRDGSYSAYKPQSSYTIAGERISRTISRSDLKLLANDHKSLTLSCDKASMTFDPAALNAILEATKSAADDKVTFTAVPADLSAFPDATAQIGTRPVYDFTISYKDSKGNSVVVPVNFPVGSASISLNYTPAAVEVTGSLFMVYVDGKGAVTWLDKSSYKVNDAEGGREGALGHDNGKVLAEVPHFSTYGVAYKAPAQVFTDIANHWAKEDMEFVAARGLLSGTGNNLFSPDGTMTRGMFVTALGRLAGINPDSYKTRSFTDVKADAYYAAYVEWAAQKNIVKGTGEGLFSPDTPVTREQMAVMMVNYAGQMGYSIPTPLAAVTFADNDRISAWAAKEVAAMQRAGIIKGRDGNRFDPQASATRAEVSAVLRRFVEIVIDPVTAQGWGKNDSGQWLYYKDGKALTGWKQIGSKWYYFDKNGIMAVNTKVDGYEIGPDGARKEDN